MSDAPPSARAAGSAEADPPPPAAGGGADPDEPARLRERVRALEEEVARLRAVIQQASDLVISADLEGRITSVNEVAERVLGFAAADLLGKPVDGLYLRKGTRAKLLARLAEAPDGLLREDVQVRGKDGRTRWLGLTLGWLRDAAGRVQGTLGVSRDVTQRRELEEELRRLSISDKLTGLYNQSHFFQVLEIEKERAIRLGHELALLLFDLDGFKHLNDTQGHARGDELLRRVGRVLFDNVRKEVDSAFRYGGDEFTVLLPGATTPIALGFGERVRAQVEALGAGVTASMGVCPFDRRNRALQIVEMADQAMYLAKRGGGNRIAFHDLASGEVRLAIPPAL